MLREFPETGVDAVHHDTAHPQSRPLTNRVGPASFQASPDHHQRSHLHVAADHLLDFAGQILTDKPITSNDRHVHPPQTVEVHLQQAGLNRIPNDQRSGDHRRGGDNPQADGQVGTPMESHRREQQRPPRHSAAPTSTNRPAVNSQRRENREASSEL